MGTAEQDHGEHYEAIDRDLASDDEHSEVEAYCNEVLASLYESDFIGWQSFITTELVPDASIRHAASRAFEDLQGAFAGLGFGEAEFSRIVRDCASSWFFASVSPIWDGRDAERLEYTIDLDARALFARVLEKARHAIEKKVARVNDATEWWAAA